MIKSDNSNGLLTPMPTSSTKDVSHKKHKKKKKKKLIDNKAKMNKHQNKNDQRVKSEREDENEQIQNGGATIIFKDDEKTVNKNDYIEKLTTNKKEKNKSKSGKTKKKKIQKKKIDK